MAIDPFARALNRAQSYGQDPQLITADANGRIDPALFAQRMRDKVEASNLVGQVPAWGPRFGITTGSPQEWSRFFTMLQQQESGHRVAPVNPDGSLRRFATTPAGEMSFGPGQFRPGEYGLKTWSDVNDPEKVADAYIRVAQAGKIPVYFGSVQRPNEVNQHAGWYDRTVAPKLYQPQPQPQQPAPSTFGQQAVADATANYTPPTPPVTPPAPQPITSNWRAYPALGAASVANAPATANSWTVPLPGDAAEMPTPYQPQQTASADQPSSANWWWQ